MVWIPAGEFMMGSHLSGHEIQSRYGEDGEDDETEAEALGDEHPRHEVRFTKGFWLGRYQVTNQEFRRFVEATGYRATETALALFKDTELGVLCMDASWREPGWAVQDDQPVVCVSWDDAQAYMMWLNEKGIGVFRLPTEAEWEYACRAGSRTVFCFGDDDALLGDYAWYRDNSEREPLTVGQKKPNAWGLYDMHGNVEEWCQDWWGDYPSGSVTDPTGPGSGPRRVSRGGAQLLGPIFCRSASRGGRKQDCGASYVGFRLCRPAQ